MSLKKLFIIFKISLFIIFGLMLGTSYAWYAYSNSESTLFGRTLSNKPTIIEIKTVIGKYSVNEGTCLVHGSPLASEDISSITLTAIGLATSQSIQVSVGKISVINNSGSDIYNITPIKDLYNTEEATIISNLLGKMNIFNETNKFNWVYRVSDTDKIENPLDSESFWKIKNL